MANDYPLTQEEFDFIYGKVPRLTVEVIVRNESGAIYMTLRSIEPCKGLWHLPGGTVFFGESLDQAVKRVAKKELGIAVTKIVNKGYIEYPSHYLHGLDQPVGLVFEVTEYSGDIVLDNEASSGDWFHQVPEKIHGNQDEYLVQAGYLSAR
jgi:8-oxo-dGTP pyrophosphatase MutT (NUDIX family)